jgi:signal transduction histidine kinase
MAELFGTGEKIAYARLSPALLIEETSQNFFDLLGRGAIGQMAARQPVTDVLWELVGAEEELDRVSEGKTPTYELARVNRSQPDGSVKYLNFSIFPLETFNTGAGLLVLVEDDTRAGDFEQQLVQDRNELKLAQRALEQAHQELQRLDRLKSLFLSVVVHDMRAPLTSILGYTELVRGSLDQGASLENQEFLAIVSAQAQWMNRLAGDLLDLEQIEAGNLKIQAEVFDLVEQVNLTVASLRESGRSKQITLTSETPEQPVSIYADPDRVRQVLYNLLGNAIKYTDDGGNVRVQAGADGEMGTFSVWNSGPALTAEEQAHLFELYYRTPDARKSQVRGSGLGLFIVKSLVDAQGGRIRVVSEPAEGTTFSVWLPLAVEPDG